MNHGNIEYEEVNGALKNVPSYWLTRFVILRLLGLIYAVAFLVLTRLFR